ncbi:hypothetical protein CIHG_08404 [Coccidioides immitis H538.4]|uniref:Uncharacterized protein n=1 Tax=Coccidioides immitis H538.4 TaxID=396776 RepID=A0A0J8RZB1_COCIT|nr:hypothetical protein CIHG_08404 [Coccidioides immitis H538.4]
MPYYEAIETGIFWVSQPSAADALCGWSLLYYPFTQSATPSLSQRVLRIVLLDFEWNKVSQHCKPGLEQEQKSLPGTYISPLLRSHEVSCPLAKFKEWVNWDYRPQFETEYAHTASSVTPYMEML